MYDIDGYGEMITDDTRMDAYVRALRGAVKPGSVVLDLGTGTGILALLASKFGARRVYAVEPAAVMQTAREIAAANGFGDVIEFHQAMSTAIALAERVDVIVSDLRGVVPLHRQHLPAIIDARRRFLAPGGVLIPQSDSLWLATVEAPDQHRRITAPWTDNKYGLDMRAARDLAANTWCRLTVKPDQLLTEPTCCGMLDYASVADCDFSAEVTSRVTRAGSAHGFCLWFDAVLADGIGFSNAPDKPGLIYGNAFFRWPEPAELLAGDSVAIGLRATLIGDDYVWNWDTMVLDQGDPGKVKARFRQSTFLGKPMTPESLRKKAADYVPALNEDGEIDCAILEKMAEQSSLGDIARHLAARYPARFAGWQDALRRVADMSSMYTR